jgi:hypothetical protein
LAIRFVVVTEHETVQIYPQLAESIDTELAAESEQ